MKNILLILAVLVFFIFQHAQAGSLFKGSTDDSALSVDTVRSFATKTNILCADTTKVKSLKSNDIEIEIVRLIKGVEVPVEGLEVLIKTSSGKKIKENYVDSNGKISYVNCYSGSKDFTFSTELSNQYFGVNLSGSKKYTLSSKIDCGQSVKLVFNEDSYSGQAVGIWQTAHKAMSKLDNSVGLGFWKEKIEFFYPGSGDYYTKGTINITNGHHWDVVAHELGHGIYDLINFGPFGGGYHKISGCYSSALAISEGWASFFAAWVGVSLDEKDAEFEYMANKTLKDPVKFENIDESRVCKGITNELRVTAFFWDLIDWNDDFEKSDEYFSKVWDILAFKYSTDMNEVKKRLIAGGFPKSVVQDVWNINYP